jgi:hypothetical protein
MVGLELKLTQWVKYESNFEIILGSKFIPIFKNWTWHLFIDRLSI